MPLLLAFLCALAAFAPYADAAANGLSLWTNRYDRPGNSYDFAKAIAVDSNGNVFVTGSSYVSGYVNADYLTVAYSGAGAPLWTNYFNGTGNGDEIPHAIAVDANGNVFVTGESDSHYATVAYSNAGLPLWTNRYTGPGNNYDAALALAVDSNGNVFVTGKSVGSAGFNYATIKYSGAGVPLWTNRYNGPRDDDQAFAIAVDTSGNVFVTGISYNGSDNDYATVAYSGAGVPLWTNRYNRDSGTGDFALAVAVDASGNVFVTGSATVAYSGTGLPLWTNYYGGQWFTAVGVDMNGNVFITGSAQRTIMFSGAGVPLWTNIYNGPPNGSFRASAIAADKTGNIFVTGRALGTHNEFEDIVTVAYSSTGVPLWTNSFNGPGLVDGDYNNAAAVAVDSSGNVFVAGSSYVSGSSYGYLTIKYAAMPAPPPPPILTHAIAASGQFHFQFNAESNLTYEVEFLDSLGLDNWTALTIIPAQPVATNLTVTNAAPNSARFFRLRIP